MAIFMGVLPGVFLKPMEPAVKKTVASVVRTNTPANTSAGAGCAEGRGIGHRVGLERQSLSGGKRRGPIRERGEPLTW
jgi:hypothetical protein